VSDDPGARGGSRPLPLIYAGYEFLLTTCLLFSVATAMRWLRDPASAAYISALRPALAVLAGLTAVLLVALILSPLGRRSGGHMNPAVTIAVWLMDVLPGASVVPYVAAQLAGSAAGVALGRLVWGPAVGTAVRYAALGAAPGVDSSAVYLGECACMIALTVLVGNFLAYPAYNRWPPETIAVAVALIIFLLGPVTGGVVNPARPVWPRCLCRPDDRPVDLSHRADRWRGAGSRLAPSAVPTIQDASAPDLQAGRFARSQRLNPREECASRIRGWR
jgi:glycerol uptake facilitator-like aquaporin